MRLLNLSFILVFLVVFSFTVYGADDVIVRSESIYDRVSPIHEATFRVYVTNNQRFSDTFTFEYFDIDWKIMAEPLTLSPGQAGSTVVKVVPVGAKEPGRYGVSLQVISERTPTLPNQHILVIDVIDYKDIFSLNFEPELPQIDPRKPGVLRLEIENKLELDFTSLSIEIKGDSFESKKTINIAGKENRLEDFSIELPTKTEQGDYPVMINLVYNNNPILQKEAMIRVSYYGDTREQESEEAGFLLRRINIVKRNEGNSIEHQLFNYEVNGLEKLFTKTSPEPTSIVKSEKGYIYRWEFDLSPREEQMITIETNYRTFFFVLLVILVLGSILYYFFNKDINLEKKIATLKHEKEDISTMKVVLSVKNKTLRTFRNVRVIDRTIKVLEMPKDFGTLKPDKIRKSERGIEMIWIINQLGGKEERVISYKMTSPLKVGNVAIPPAYLRYGKGG